MIRSDAQIGAPLASGNDGKIDGTTRTQPKLLTTKQAADLLNVSSRTLLNWTETDKVPYQRLPGGDYRVPLAGLLGSLSGTYRLDEELRALDARHAGVSDEDVQAALVDR